MTERPEQQHGTRRAVTEVEVAGVTDRGADSGRVGDRSQDPLCLGEAVTLLALA